MTLREKIELCLRAEPDPAKAAILVMGMIEMHGPEVSGTGWVEDDPVLTGGNEEWAPFCEACDRADAILKEAGVEPVES